MRARKVVLTLAAAMLGAAGPSTVQYTYDPLGRVTTAVNAAAGICTTYSYDLNNNRTAQATTSGGSQVTAVWGSGVWGCAPWSP
jgi:YD repeat-containing protein